MAALLLFFFAVSSLASSSSVDRGFNSKIAWTNDLAAARAQTDKPVFLLIHKTWCGACKRLKSTFGDEKLEQRSRDFVMVNLEDDEEPAEAAFKPDGGYIPRIFFLKGNTVLPVTNEAGNPQYKVTLFFFFFFFLFCSFLIRLFVSVLLLFGGADPRLDGRGSEAVQIKSSFAPKSVVSLLFLCLVHTLATLLVCHELVGALALDVSPFLHALQTRCRLGAARTLPHFCSNPLCHFPENKQTNKNITLHPIRSS